MVLILEDDDDTRTALIEVMDMFQIEHLAVATATAAIDVMQKTCPDMLLADLVLSNETGITAIEFCKKIHGYQCKTVIMTALNNALANNIATALQVDAVLLKPFNLDALCQIIHHTVV